LQQKPNTGEKLKEYERERIVKVLSLIYGNAFFTTSEKKKGTWRASNKSSVSGCQKAEKPEAA